MDSSRRREEIEKKKKAIAELKRTREERSRALQDTRSVEAQSHAARRKELEDLVASLVGEKARKEEAKSAPPPVMAAVETVVHQIAMEMPADTAPAAEMRLKPAPKLGMASMVLFETPPQEKVFYERDMQTTESSFQTDEPEEQVVVEGIASPEEPEPEPEPVPEIPETRVMDEVEREIILQSWQFQEFFDKSSRLVERALTSKFDTLTDYTMHDDDVRRDVDTGKGVKNVCTFFDERWTKNRSVTDVSWSPRHPELLLASYNKSQTSIHDPDGIVLVWNANVPARPEFSFHAPSDVTCATFSDFHPNLVVGGTYSGQILVWDNRAKSAAVLKTPLSGGSGGGGHAHPVYSVAVVGTQNAHSLVTCGTDGTVCAWQMDMLAVPQEVLELAHVGGVDGGSSSNAGALGMTIRPTNEVAVTCFGFPANETNTFWVGTEEGGVYQANRYDRAGGKAGINSLDGYMGHHGLVTSLHFHPSHPNSPHDFSDLFLTSSVDWTVNLWKAKSLSKQATAAAPSHSKISPLRTFDEFHDYVLDAKWSPVHPSLFACADAGGVISFYDLNLDVEVTTATANAVGEGTTGSGKAVNKIAWDRTAAGDRIACGTSDGRVSVLDVGELGRPRADEFAAFQRTLVEIGVKSAATSAVGIFSGTRDLEQF